MEIVGTRLGDHVDNAAHASAVLGVERTGQHAEFLRRVDIRERTRQARLRLVVVRIVEQVVGRAAARVDQTRRMVVGPSLPSWSASPLHEPELPNGKPRRAARAKAG